MTTSLSGQHTQAGEEKQRFPTYLEAMERLVGVVQALSQARDVATITRIARDAARELAELLRLDVAQKLVKLQAA